MTVQCILCGLSAAVTAILYGTLPALSLWWLAPLLIGSYATIVIWMLLSVYLVSCILRGAKPTKARYSFYRLFSILVGWVASLCGTRVHSEGLDRLPTDRPCLLVGNHLSNLDPIVAIAALRDHETAFISKPENFKIPLIGLILLNLNFLPIDRENPRNAVTTIKTAAQHITERALCVGIYPEGTRNKAGEGLLPFHNGSFKIATAAKCPVAVMTVRYEKGRFPYRRIARLKIVEVLDADYVTANRTDAISERARAIIENDLKK